MIQGHGQAGIGVVVLGDEKTFHELIGLFETISQEQDWQPGNELHARKKHSVHFGLLVRGVLAGGLLLARHMPKFPFSCFAVWPELENDYGGDTNAAHIVLLALHKDYRGRQAFFWPLCIKMWQYCWSEGITTLLAEVTPANLRMYRRLGWPLHVIGELRPHWGEPCLPCRMDMTELTASIVAKAQHSSRYQEIVQQAFRDMPSGTGCTT